MTDTAPGRRHVHPSELNLFHKNPRRGNVAVIKASLRANGQYKPVVVNIGTHTGRPNEVLTGNHTVIAIRDLAEEYPDAEQWQQVLIHEIDVDDDRAARIVAADNRTSEVGGFDDRLLLELLSDLPDLDGTGYDDTDITALEDIIAGAPDLDALEDEVGEPEPDDHLVSLSLKVEPDLQRAWATHRKNFSDDSAALSVLLDDAA
ncbi:hypothetical protein [Nocardia transvalensis]|uniref:hypothetical protein n=1 Tax=Nocardia transvalensis TaxID=37333 RepID=UPI001893B7F7|nr:hypothetical protein [Nocardia transvalensis]MBF6332406.1 hypothetical protein [Nocardia transvalensis]